MPPTHTLAVATGMIGPRYPMERIEPALGPLVANGLTIGLMPTEFWIAPKSNRAVQNLPGVGQRSIATVFIIH